MDGIGSKEGVLMLASTNRADILDKVYLNMCINNNFNVYKLKT